MKILLISLMLVISLPLVAQNNKPKLTKVMWWELAADVAARTGDTITTRRFLTAPCHCYYEQHPYPGFVDHNWWELETYGMVAPTISWLVTRTLVRHHHNKLAYVSAGFDAVYDGEAVVHNYVLVKEP